MKRPRGHAAWKPQAGNRRLVAEVQAILAQYVSVYGPMTLRQILYRLAALFGHPKDHDAANRLSTTLVRARRAKLIPWDDMRDDRGVVEYKNGWASSDTLIDSVTDWVKNFELHGDIGQPYRTLIWSEAAGMVGMVADMAKPYGVEVRSKSGFDGAGAKRQLAHDIETHYAETGRPTRLLHLGDYDPAGRNIYNALFEDIIAFVPDPAAYLLERVALTPEQIAQYGVTPDMDGNVQLEAIDPPDLQVILTVAIERLWDFDAHARLLKQQERDRSRLQAWLALATEEEQA
jgi:hypothetical protein